MVETTYENRGIRIPMENNGRRDAIQVDYSVYEEQEKMLQMMFAQNQRVPELKPVTELRFCGEELDCGHACGGCKGEQEHLPCLELQCRPADSVTKSDGCQVCQAGELGDAPSVELDCGHIFHANCIRDLLRHRWSTQRITFNFMKCPSCCQEIEGAEHVPEIRMEIFAMRILKRRLQKQALNELKIDKMDKAAELSDPLNRFFQKPMEYALHVSEFYECSRCHGPFFGGYVDCQAELAIDDEHDEIEEEHLMCQGCRHDDMGCRKEFNCNKHGIRHVQYKCDFCCAVATFRCHANTYYCDACHEEPHRRNKLNCGGNANKCPFNITHNATKRGVPIAGCIICTSEMTVSNHITLESQHEIHLKRALAHSDSQLKRIVREKKAAKVLCESARSTSSKRSSFSSSHSNSSQRSSSSKSFGRIVF